MRLLAGWLILVVVSCSTMPEASAPRTAVRVLSHTHSIQTDIRPRYSITGELINESDVPVYSAQVQAKYFDSLDRSLAEMSTTAALRLLQPGQRSPFFITLSADTPLLQSVERYELLVTSSATPPSSGEVVPLTVASHRLELATSQTSRALTIAGDVTNSSGAAVDDVALVATIYDQQGRITNYGHSSAVGPDIAPRHDLGSGQTAPFAVRTGLSGEDNDTRLPDGYTYTIQAEGYR
jgi:hypothetical protein